MITGQSYLTARKKADYFHLLYLTSHSFGFVLLTRRFM